MRALIGVVIGMGILIILGVGILGFTLVRRLGPTPGVTAMTVQEPDGTRIAGVSGSQDRLMLLMQGGGPDRVVVMDQRTGKVVGRVSLAQ